MLFEVEKEGSGKIGFGDSRFVSYGVVGNRRGCGNVVLGFRVE